MEKLRLVLKWYTTLIIVAVFSVFAAIYFNSVEGLAKPAGLTEAIEFLIDNPKAYTTCLLCGFLAKLAYVMMIGIAILSILMLIMSIVRFKVDEEPVDIKEMVLYIANIIVAVVIGMIQASIVSYFWILLGTVLLIAIVVIAIFNNK